MGTMLSHIQHMLQSSDKWKIIASHLLMFVLYLKRDSNPTRYDIKSELSLEEPGVIGPPFNFTFQVRAKSISTIT